MVLLDYHTHSQWIMFILCQIKMSHIINGLKTNPNIPDFIVNAIPDDVAEIKKYGVDFISSHLTSIGKFW